MTREPYDRGKWTKHVRDRLSERAPTSHPLHVSADDRRSIAGLASLLSDHADYKTGQNARISNRGAYLAAGLRPEHVRTGAAWLVSEDLGTRTGTTSKNVGIWSVHFPDRDSLSRGTGGNELTGTATLSVAHRDSLSRGTATLSVDNLSSPDLKGGGGGHDPSASPPGSTPREFLDDLSRRLDLDVDRDHEGLVVATLDAVAAGVNPDDVDLSRFKPSSSPAGLLSTRIRRAIDGRGALAGRSSTPSTSKPSTPKPTPKPPTVAKLTDRDPALRLGTESKIRTVSKLLGAGIVTVDDVLSAFRVDSPFDLDDPVRSLTELADRDSDAFNVLKKITDPRKATR